MALDDIDKLIIKELQKDSKITMKMLGEIVNLTGQAVNMRIARLESEGVIENYTITVNQNRLGCEVHAFITVYMHKISHQPFLDFVDKESIYIINNYKIIGDGCYLLECRFPSNRYLDEFLVKLNNFANYKVSTVLK